MAKANKNKVNHNKNHDDDIVVVVGVEHFDTVINREGGSRVYQWAVSASGDHPTQSGTLFSGQAKTLDQCADAIVAAIDNACDNEGDDDEPVVTVKPKRKNKAKPKVVAKPADDDDDDDDNADDDDNNADNA